MADFNDLAKLKMDSKTTLKASDIHIHDFSLDQRATRRGAAGNDILEQVTRAAKQATETQPRTSLKIDEFEMDFDGLRADLGDDSPEDVLLREARRLTKAEDFHAALAKLDEVFAIAPQHHEATYLKAFCKFMLGKLKPALQALLELKDVFLKSRLRTRVRTLKEDIRQKTLPTAARAYADAVKKRQAAKVIDPLREFVDTDPEVGKFYYFLAGAYLIEKRMNEARNVVRDGLEVSECDRGELEELHLEIERHFLPEMLGPARNLFRQNKYREAAVALADVPADVQGCALWKSFSGYLRQFSGRGPASGGLTSTRGVGGIKNAVAPPGTPAEVKELYEFLVEPEMRAARSAVASKQLASAEKSLNAALALTPNFSVANHMLATCVYQRVGTTVKQKIGKDLDEKGAKELGQCKNELDSVRERALIASRDPDLTDAQRLLKSIEEMQKDIAKVLENREAQVHDAEIVNKAIDDFLTLLTQLLAVNAATGQAETLMAVLKLYGKLRTMRSDLTSLRNRCKGSQAREIVDLVRDKFVEPQYQQLKFIEPQYQQLSRVLNL